MVVFAIASFGCTIPHFIYGDKLLEAHLKLSGGGFELNAMEADSNGGFVSLSQWYANESATRQLKEASSNLCHASTFFENRTANFSHEQTCSDDLKDEQMNQSNITSVVLLIFTVCLLIIGVGQTAVSTLGIPYIDDNVASRESPIYIGKFLHKFSP